ncbi:hypothetical protein LINPERPRIM_LOCUS39029 [Linum perenne]
MEEVEDGGLQGLVKEGDKKERGSYVISSYDIEVRITRSTQEKTGGQLESGRGSYGRCKFGIYAECRGAHRAVVHGVHCPLHYKYPRFWPFWGILSSLLNPKHIPTNPQTLEHIFGAI